MSIIIMSIIPMMIVMMIRMLDDDKGGGGRKGADGGMIRETVDHRRLIDITIKLRIDRDDSLMIMRMRLLIGG